jgi:hypothetical protein
MAKDYGKMKMNYAGGGGKSGGAFGPGGLKAAAARQPHDHAGLGSSPDGPYAHCLGYEGDGGMQGDTKVSGKMGYSFWIK